jgi:hypothetical protein
MKNRKNRRSLNHRMAIKRKKNNQTLMKRIQKWAVVKLTANPPKRTKKKRSIERILNEKKVTFATNYRICIYVIILTPFMCFV